MKLEVCYINTIYPKTKQNSNLETFSSLSRDVITVSIFQHNYIHNSRKTTPLCYHSDIFTIVLASLIKAKKWENPILGDPDTYTRQCDPYQVVKRAYIIIRHTCS